MIENEARMPVLLSTNTGTLFYGPSDESIIKAMMESSDHGCCPPTKGNKNRCSNTTTV
jgi:hypothetical protein